MRKDSIRRLCLLFCLVIGLSLPGCGSKGNDDRDTETVGMQDGHSVSYEESSEESRSADKLSGIAENPKKVTEVEADAKESENIHSQTEETGEEQDSENQDAEDVENQNENSDSESDSKSSDLESDSKTLDAKASDSKESDSDDTKSGNETANTKTDSGEPKSDKGENQKKSKKKPGSDKTESKNSGSKKKKENTASNKTDNVSKDTQNKNEETADNPQSENAESNKEICSLLIDCSLIYNQLDQLTKGKEAILPADGIIYHNTSVAWEEGDTVFDILLREMQANKIHMEYVDSTVYDSAYIEGIGNIYEFDCGELSGWRYSVNGVYPNYGCSQYEVQPGDIIEWHYSLDLGKDL